MGTMDLFYSVGMVINFESEYTKKTKLFKIP